VIPIKEEHMINMDQKEDHKKMTSLTCFLEGEEVAKEVPQAEDNCLNANQPKNF
jgi:hypothetical protein